MKVKNIISSLKICLLELIHQKNIKKILHDFENPPSSLKHLSNVIVNAVLLSRVSHGSGKVDWERHKKN